MPLYNDFKEQLLRGTFDLSANTIKVALVAAYTPNIDTHTSFADITAVEVTGTGYTARGNAVANKTVTQDNTNDRAAFDGDNVTWTALSVGTPSHAVIYKDTGTNSTSLLIGYWAISTASNGGDYTLAFDATGIVLLT